MAEDLVGLTLSGGGHRATLFGLGSLLALVDLRLNRKVTQIASVSGGSILNAFVAHQCRFEDATQETFDPIARELARLVVNRGVLTKRLIFWFAGTAVALPVVAIAALLYFGALPLPALSAFSLILLLLALLLLRGIIVERIFDARYFQSDRRVLLSDLKAKGVDHVICCTELTTSNPFYVSSWNSGRAFLRELSGLLGSGTTAGRIWNVSELPLSAAVRASAGFPGIPPRRIRLARFRPAPKKPMTFGGKVKPKPEPPSPTIFLSDGGFWNNLGTQVLIEDRLFQAEQIGGPSILFAINASGGLRSQWGVHYCIPGWAELKALLRVMLIQNLNTVGPRVDNLERMRERDWAEDKAPSHLSPMVIHVGISRSPEDLLKGWYNSFIRRPVALFSRSERDWALDTLIDIEKIMMQDDPGQKEMLLTQVDKSLRQRPDPRVDEERRRIEDLETWSGFNKLCSMAQGNLESVSTNLDRTPRETAIALIARGYVNTLAGAFVFGLVDNHPDMLSGLTRERLEFLTS